MTNTHLNERIRTLTDYYEAKVDNEALRKGVVMSRVELLKLRRQRALFIEAEALLTCAHSN